MPAIVLTGFEPFGGDVENPSQEIAKRLDSRRLGEHLVRSAVLPVQHEAAHGLEEASMDLPLMIRAVEASLRAIAR